MILNHLRARPAPLYGLKSWARSKGWASLLTGLGMVFAGCSSSHLVVSSDIRVEITSPMEGARLTEADDCNSARSGLQIRVVADVEAPEGSIASVKLGDLAAVEAGITEGRVEACVAANPGENIAIVVTASNEALGITNGDTVTISIGQASSTLTITAPSDGAQLGIADDCDATRAGLQIRVQAISSLPAAGSEATMQVGSGSPVAVPLMAATSGSTLDACLDAPEGDAVAIVVTARNAAQKVDDSAQVRVKIDLGALAVDITAPTNGETLGVTDDCSADAGMQVRVQANVVAPAGSTATVQIGGESPATAAIAFNGVNSGRIDACVASPAAGTVAVVVIVRNESQTKMASDTLNATVDLAALSVTITAPSDGAVFNASNDCDAAAGVQLRVQGSLFSPLGAATTTATVQFGTAASIPVTVTANGTAGIVDACVNSTDGNPQTLTLTVQDSAAATDSDTTSVTIDTQPPTSAISLSFEVPPATRRAGQGSYRWTSIEDAGGGPLKRFELRCAKAPIDDESKWTAASIAPIGPTPGAAGTAHSQPAQRFVGARDYCVLRGYDFGENPTPFSTPNASTLIEVPYLQQAFELPTTAGRVDAITPVGDVNGDNLPDVLAAANNRVYLVFGAADPATKTTWDVEIAGASNGSTCGAFGRSIAGIGDMNGDGRADFAIGSPSYDTNGATSGNCQGRVYVFFGRASGNAWPATINTGAASGVACPADLCLNGSGTSANQAYLGFALTSAGDFNGDGLADLAIGARYYGAYVDPFTTNEGRAVIVLGGTDLAAGGALIDRPVFDGSANEPSGFVVAPPASMRELGTALTTAGDLNGDGRSDLLLTAFGDSFNSPPTVPSQVSQLLGRAYGGNGLVAINGSELNAVASGTTARFGVDLRAVGDFDGDGRIDLGISDGQQIGQALIYLQRSNSFAGGVPVVNLLNDLPTNSGDAFARRLASGFQPGLASLSGDVDKDGRADILTGSRYRSGTAASIEILAGRSAVADQQRSLAAASFSPEPTTNPLPNDGFRTPTYVGDANNDAWVDWAIADAAYAGASGSRSRIILFY